MIKESTNRYVPPYTILRYRRLNYMGVAKISRAFGAHNFFPSQALASLQGQLRHCL